MQNICRNFGVIGDPIAHSLSPIIHNYLFSHFGLDAHYEKIHLKEASALRSRLLALAGANITLPYKNEAFRVCDEVFGIACEIEAVNTIISKDSKLLGFNTDALGFWECIKEFEIQNALILGAGGSARAIAVILQKQGIQVSIYNRTSTKLEFFTQKKIEIFNQDAVKKGDIFRNYDLLIHSTSAGLDGVSLPLESEILAPLICGAKCVFDVIYPTNQKIQKIEDFKDFLYSRRSTTFLDFAKRIDKRKDSALTLANQQKIIDAVKGKADFQIALDGLDMLLFQALFAFEIFSQGEYCFEELKRLFYAQI